MKKKIAYLTFLLMTFSAQISAEEPKIVTGTKNLFNDGLGWILILIPIATALMIGYHALLKLLSDADPGVVAEKNKKMKSTLVAGIIGESAMGIVTAVFKYYQ